MAFGKATGSDPHDARDILAQYRKDTRVSIEDFANTVKAWIDRQAPNFRLNFFVDEVGQYIADNVKLMTNLQTIAESLNTKCKGQAWIIVTAQQAITVFVTQRLQGSRVFRTARNGMDLRDLRMGEQLRHQRQSDATAGAGHHDVRGRGQSFDQWRHFAASWRMPRRLRLAT